MTDTFRLESDAALLAGDHEAALRGYARALPAAVEAAGGGGLADLIFNLTLARRRWRRARQNVAPRIAVCGWEMGHNAAGRVQTLAELHATTGAAEVAMIGALFPKWGNRLWPPLDPPGFPCRLLQVTDPTVFPRQALEFVSAHPYDMVHLSKPRMPNILFGLLYKLIWDAHVILDIDDEELGVVKAETPLALAEMPRGPDGLPDWSELTGKAWTRIAVGLAGRFAARSVSNPALQRRYDGLILPHARDAARFARAAALRATTRSVLGLPAEAKVVLFFGTVRRHKGVLELARALKALGRRDLCLAVIGEIASAELRAELQALAGPDLILHLHSMQPYARAAEVVTAGDICVLLQEPTSLMAQNQLPAKLVDALAGGLAVLATPTPALADLIEAGAVRATSAETLTADLRCCLEDPDGLAVLRARGQAVFARQLDMTSQAPVLAALQSRPAPQPTGQPLPEGLAGTLEALGGLNGLLREPMTASPPPPGPAPRASNPAQRTAPDAEPHTVAPSAFPRAGSGSISWCRSTMRSRTYAPASGRWCRSVRRCVSG